MGFIDTSTDQEIPVLYNVVHAVGRQCPNYRDDVKLIQYLLIAYYDKAPAFNGCKKPPGELTVTGFCGPTTMNWILEYQRYMWKRGNAVTLDGRIDRMRNKELWGTISDTWYTLALLNHGVKKYNYTAFVMTPTVIPLENPMNVPPPSNDIIRELPIPSTAGF